LNLATVFGVKPPKTKAATGRRTPKRIYQTGLPDLSYYKNNSFDLGLILFLG
jgi:hypothetical protein